MHSKQNRIVVHTPEGQILPGRLFGIRVITSSPVEVRLDARNRGLMRRLLRKKALIESKSAPKKPARPATTEPSRSGKDA